MEESYICPNCGSFSFSRDIICPQCGHRSARSGGGSKLPIFIGVVVVGIIAAVGAVFASGGFSGDSLPVAPVSSPIDTDIETTKTSEIPTPTATPTPAQGCDASQITNYVSGPHSGIMSSAPVAVGCPAATLTPSLTDIPRPTLGVEVGDNLARFSNQPSPKSCPGCDFTGADLTYAVLRDADLTGANLARAYLTNADLIDADLTEADLREANLTGADLLGVNLTETNLAGANLTGADLTSAFLKGAILDGVIGADFTGAWEDWGKLIIEP